eukprot:gnl/TRDRNA2_/TRDRNA2_189358_c0_seq1.p1 gnl/TRDRNA2_/TRDRNA2_189358_c0~~gnl/TRDRNA2_/TRDRNA2_189358_c0_seq1.p1  ORF type:complete len:437 (-),score=95.45 gnl/TRDRNA2_/TRDRNA2_189358_c0_seq1:108-1265(-)
MEDAHLMVPDLDGSGNISVFGVFDGHGGRGVSRFAAKHLPELIRDTEAFRNGDYAKALSTAFLAVDDRLNSDEGRQELEVLDSNGGRRSTIRVPRKEIMRLRMGQSLLDEESDESGKADGDPTGGPEGENGDNADDDVEIDPSAILRDPTPEAQGCTAVVALVVWSANSEGAKGARLFVANAGDSRCIVCCRDQQNPEVVEMSEDQKPDLESERLRIEAAGGFVQACPGGSRVQGDLNLSRAMGDMRYKNRPDLPAEEQIVTADPEVRLRTLEAEDRFIVLGCDGIWERNENLQLTEKLLALHEAEVEKGTHLPELSALGGAVCDWTICPSMCPTENPSFDGTGCDNMTVLIVELQQPAAAGAAAAGDDEDGCLERPAKQARTDA